MKVGDNLIFKGDASHRGVYFGKILATRGREYVLIRTKDYYQITITRHLDVVIPCSQNLFKLIL